MKYPVNPYPESKNTILASNIKCSIIDACQKKFSGKIDILSISGYGFTYKPLTDSLLHTVAFEGHFKLTILLNEIVKGILDFKRWPCSECCMLSSG